MADKFGRRAFLKTCGLGASACAFSSIRPHKAESSERPNVLFLFTDDQRFNTIHALGNDRIITPNIDRLVRCGTAFTNAYVMGAHMVAAVCMPSRAMLMTGRTLFHLKERGSELPPEHVTMPEAFRRAGYTTFHTGKWHNDRASFARSFTTADKIFFGGMSSHYNIPIQDYDPSGRYPNDRRYWVTDTHSTELYADAAVRFLESYGEEAPFFMYVAFQSPHDPRHMPRKYIDMYNPTDIPLPPNYLPTHPFDFGEANHRDEKLERWPRTPEKIKRHLADYYAFITYTDAAIGRILDALDKTGKRDNTIIVFAGDNGLAVGSHGLMGKQNLYEHSIHVPLVMAGPGIPSGGRNEALCYLLDIYPTLCGLAGLDVPVSVEGQSLVPVLSGERRSMHDTLFFAFKNFQRAVRTDRWKLIRFNVFGDQHTCLFDLKNDPWETKNLADDPAQTGRLREMNRLLQREITANGDAVDLSKSDWGVPVIEPWKLGKWVDPNENVYYDAEWSPGPFENMN